MKRFLRTLILALVYVLGAAQQTRKISSQGPRILLIRPDHLGDLVMMTPILHAIRQRVPNAHITMMIGPWSSEIVARHPAIDRLITCRFPGFQRAVQQPFAPYTLLLSTAQQLQREHYDLAINLRPDFWWGAALLYLARIPYRIGYAIQPGTPFLTHSHPFPPTEHSTVSNLRLANIGLQALGYPELDEPYTFEHYPLVFTPTDDERSWVANRLLQDGIDKHSPVVVIHPGTGGAVKLWRSEAWAHVANTLTTSQAFSTPLHIVLTGNKQERPLLEEIAHGMSTTSLLINDMTVGQLAALLERAHLVLGVDNGPLHLAVAQNSLTLQIFGPTDVRIFGPWGSPDRHAVLTATQPCSTCLTIPCGRLDFTEEELIAHPCVRLITEHRVEAAIATLLGTSLSSQQSKR